MARGAYAVFAVSLFLHLVVFWPGAARQVQHPVTPLLVRFVSIPAGAPVAKVKQGLEGELTEQHAVASNAVGVSGAKRPSRLIARGPQQSIAQIELGRTSADMPIGDGDRVLRELGALSAPVLPLEDEAGDVVSVGRYRLALAVAVVRLQQGSREVLALGLNGRSVVSVHVMPGRQHPDVRVAQSSGYPVLDERALALVWRAVHDVPVPLQGQQFSVVLPVLFDAM